MTMIFCPLVGCKMMSLLRNICSLPYPPTRKQSDRAQYIGLTAKKCLRAIFDLPFSAKMASQISSAGMFVRSSLSPVGTQPANYLCRLETMVRPTGPICL